MPTILILIALIADVPDGSSFAIAYDQAVSQVVRDDVDGRAAIASIDAEERWRRLVGPPDVRPAIQLHVSAEGKRHPRTGACASAVHFVVDKPSSPDFRQAHVVEMTGSYPHDLDVSMVLLLEALRARLTAARGKRAPDWLEVPAVFFISELSFHRDSGNRSYLYTHGLNKTVPAGPARLAIIDIYPAENFGRQNPWATLALAFVLEETGPDGLRRVLVRASATGDLLTDTDTPASFDTRFDAFVRRSLKGVLDEQATKPPQ